ncbi:putative RNA polymerase II transcription factor SIII subunit A [Aspergillus terreus]|uniref:Putative RNA polymerase II transcription factor SIII subunit A n=1 Tax=Aspergillus terreus TaxID=33178 RepID=A0A5M3ZC86_ASPTE|nr:hypothetical protein ATETN484_0014015300 [Aspergillus terreus]GFF20819.1 putative RNA polymerase II transcription factor SIII subunit A [Aspergillus terreus]
MPAPSLLQLATASATRNVKYLNDIGNIPYSLARPFLLKIESPEKLRTLEIQSPHLIKEDEELWLEFIRRDIPRWEEYELPDNPECWYEVYCDLRERVQRAVDEDAERLKMALDGIKTERAKHSAKFVPDRRDMHLPRERPTTKQRYASFDRRVGGIRPVFAGQRSALGSSDPSGTPLWSFERPQLPRETKKKNSIFTATKRNNVLAVPTKQLNNRASQVKQAPRSLLEEHIRPPPVPAPRRKEPVAAGTPSLRVPGRSRMQSAVQFTFVGLPSCIYSSITGVVSRCQSWLGSKPASERITIKWSGSTIACWISNIPGECELRWRQLQSITTTTTRYEHAKKTSS